jgi:hypothetical protein
MSGSPQSFKNHVKFVPLFHFVTLPLLMLNVVWWVRRLVQVPGTDRAVVAISAIAIFAAVIFARTAALKVQDRVIRLEMRLRLATVLPQDTRSRINDLTPAQLVGLRFASDGELPGLVATVLKDNIQNKTAIKKMIKNWTPDHLRA